jgi:hypothetical protein
MTTSFNSRLAFLVFAVLLTKAIAAAEPWPVVDQPELKQSLESAVLLKPESLGEPAHGIQPWEHDIVPNLDGQTWDVLQWYMEYGPGGRQQLFIIDMGTGKWKSQSIPGNTPIYTAGRALGFDGKYYIVTLNRQPYSLSLYVYDPASDSLEDRGLLVDWPGGELRPVALGPNGRIYGTGLHRDGKVGLYCYDPESRRLVRDYGGVGPSHTIGSTIPRGIGVDDTHAYIISGELPCYLVAVELATGNEKVLFEIPHLTAPSGERMEIISEFPGAWANVPRDDGLSDQYWLYHGNAISKSNQVRPWPDQVSPWDRAGPRPELYYDQLDPDEHGNAVLWFRAHGDAAQDTVTDRPRDAAPEELGWNAIHLAGVKTYAGRLGPLALLPDGRLYGAGEYYVGSFLFDPATGTTTRLGRNQGLSGYTNIVAGDKLYSSGYPGGPLFVYDPKRPWTAHHAGSPGHPAPAHSDPRCNPRRLGAFEQTTRTAIMHSSVAGADGKLYFGGFGARHYTGGGLGWYDPRTNELDGIWKPFSGYAIYHLARARDGRSIVISTATAADELQGGRVSAEAKLFVFDVATRSILREITPVPGARSTGLIIKTSPGRLLGLTTTASEYGQGGTGILYGADLDAGDVLFRKELPTTVSTDDYWPHWVDPSQEDQHLALDRNGFVWTLLKNVLVRIDPQNARVQVVGKLEPPGRPIIVGNDIYLSGTTELRRMPDMVPLGSLGLLLAPGNKL